VSVFVDTSVWSLALRRDAPTGSPEVAALTGALNRGEQVYITGLVLQELLQGFAGPRARDQVIEHLAPLPLLVPDRRDHIDAAELRNRCRRAGLQLGTVDALLAQLCIRHDLVMLTTDNDFRRIDRHAKLRVWSG
jgi:predicted nucleic acid-binding protein